MKKCLCLGWLIFSRQTSLFQRFWQNCVISSEKFRCPELKLKKKFHFFSLWIYGGVKIAKFKQLTCNIVCAITAKATNQTFLQSVRSKFNCGLLFVFLIFFFQRTVQQNFEAKLLSTAQKAVGTINVLLWFKQSFILLLNIVCGENYFFKKEKIYFFLHLRKQVIYNRELDFFAVNNFQISS